MYILVAAFSVFVTCSAHSRNCLDDFDLVDRPIIFPTDPRGHKVYEYDIPHADEPEYWAPIQEDGLGVPRHVAWNRNFYIFGKFFDDSADKRDSTITAGLYRGDELIYKTVINCEKGTWENWILNKSSELERILHGKIDTDLTSCKGGDDFDLILKNDNFRLANWIFNAQALQHDVRRFDRKTNKVEAGRLVIKTNILRPLVKVNSKYSVYDATKFRFEATGKAFFNRLAFGQCNAWPKNMEMQCQKVREWVHARSKANLTDYSLADLQGTRDENVTHGLGTFGNNMQVFNPNCITDKYFNWMQMSIHPDQELPLYETDDHGRKTGRTRSDRAYCCCIDMKTGQVLNNDPDKNCELLQNCETHQALGGCVRAYDPDIGKEIQEEQEQEEGGTA